jgi:hypothetical protein
MIERQLGKQAAFATGSIGAAVPARGARPNVVRRLVLTGAVVLTAIAVAAWITRGTNGSKLAECQVYPRSAAFAPYVDTIMRVRGNVSCAMSLRRSADSVADVRLTMPPDNGVVTVALDSVSYRPNPAFRGRDFFAVAVPDQSAHFEGRSVARVHVFVR